MPIRDNIRKRVNEVVRKKTHLKHDYELYPKAYELHSFLRRSGYLLNDIIYHPDLGRVELVIQPKVPGYLHPDISHDIEDNKFYVKVSSHGFLESSDLEDIMKGYSNALGVLEELSRADLSGIKEEYLK